MWRMRFPSLLGSCKHRVHATSQNSNACYVTLGATDLGLTYDFSQGTPRQGLYGYFDASFADCVDTRRSTVAHVFFFKGAVVSWKTRLYSFVTTSTNHSELVASAMAAREAKFLLLLFTALGLCEQASSANPGTSAGATVDLFTDSMGVVAIARSSALSSATIH